MIPGLVWGRAGGGAPTKLAPRSKEVDVDAVRLHFASLRKNNREYLNQQSVWPHRLEAMCELGVLRARETVEAEGDRQRRRGGEGEGEGGELVLSTCSTAGALRDVRRTLVRE